MLRSLLFVPGNRSDMLHKASSSTADALVPDLEDSVPLTEKMKGREVVREVVPSLARSGHVVIPRVNALSTGLVRDDLEAIVDLDISGVWVSKLESVWELREISRILSVLEERAGIPVGHTRIFGLLESANALQHSYDICRSSSRLAGVALGAEDFLMDSGVPKTESGEETAFPRSKLALAANAARVFPVDGPYIDVRDAQGLEKHIRSALLMGYKGKFAIHPNQVEPINQAFSPSQEEIDYAQRVVQVAEEAEARGHGAVALDGKLVDLPIVERARRLLTAAEAIRVPHA